MQSWPAPLTSPHGSKSCAERSLCLDRSQISRRRSSVRLTSERHSVSDPASRPLCWAGSCWAEVPYGWIRWLAVRSCARGIGIGQRLVEEDVKQLATSNAISVDTFREENMEGRPARRLYERLGFPPGPLVQIEDLPRQPYTLPEFRTHQELSCATGAGW
jgi:hypothetical protein